MSHGFVIGGLVRVVGDLDGKALCMRFKEGRHDRKTGGFTAIGEAQAFLVTGWVGWRGRVIRIEQSAIDYTFDRNTILVQLVTFDDRPIDDFLRMSSDCLESLTVLDLLAEI